MARRRGGRVSSARDIEMEIRAQVRKDEQLDRENDVLAKQVKEFIQSETPIDEGDAVASVKIREVKKPRNGLPARTVYSDDWKFHMLEYGTKADPPDSESPFGPDTPTKAYAPFGKAKARFGDQL
ncbi:minor tail protein [Mycobacterium phage ThulaThula]|uniref:Uncharacterized protein n=1 Tax=Mycobacterium phage ThulaThula TaxID=2599880 RepID=A0A5J6TDY4_9CAUD|nr:minor tail protein [Mycobacterium phage ThulaThula]QFG09040.1 hypothetical protein PBI_THULATHULA_11 [Mycobacterium phage ThulaThula]